MTSISQVTYLANNNDYFHSEENIPTFLTEPVVVTLKHRPAHTKICQLDCSARVDQAVPAGNISVNILQLCQVLQASSNISSHGGQSSVGHFIQVLAVSFIHKVAPSQQVPMVRGNEYCKFYNHLYSFIRFEVTVQHELHHGIDWLIPCTNS